MNMNMSDLQGVVTKSHSTRRREGGAGSGTGASVSFQDAHSATGPGSGTGDGPKNCYTGHWSASRKAGTGMHWDLECQLEGGTDMHWDLECLLAGWHWALEFQQKPACPPFFSPESPQKDSELHLESLRSDTMQGEA